MARLNPVFVCSSCGGETLKWQGQCPLCGEWNSLEQRAAGRARAVPAAAAVTLGAKGQATAGSERLMSGQGELDRVLGGGPGARLGHPAGRGARHRQIDAAAAGGRTRGPEPPGAVRQRRGVGGADAPALRSASP